MRNPTSTLNGPTRPRLAPGARLIAPLAMAAAVVAGITACSSSPASSPTHATAHAARSGGGGLAYAACMRSHGVPNFPDPSPGSSGAFQFQLGGSGIDPSSPAFQTAQRSCQSLQPAGKTSGGSVSTAARDQVLRYAACIRAHGEPNYPDPTFNGNAINFGNLSGIDPNSAQYQSALRACASLNPASGHGGSK
jgi:hypothetical protein